MSPLPRVLEPEVMDTVEEAVDYDSMDHGQVNRQFVDDLLAFCSCAAGGTTLQGTILDLGTGTALIPLELLSRGCVSASILASDLSLEMLRLADRHVRQNGHSRSVLPLFSDAKTLPLGDASCDVVMSNSIVHHIPSPLDVFREMRRVIRPGGTLFVRDLMRPASDAQVEHFVVTYAGEENEHQKQMFRQSLHAALTVEEVRQFLAESGFNPDWVAASSDRHWTIAGRAE